MMMVSAGVCGTDLAILSGTRAAQAEVLGHEGVGIVVYAPEGCGISKGAKVIINPVHRQHPHTVIGHSCNGIFRELFCLDVVDAVEGGELVPCPGECSVTDADLVLAEPLASVLYSSELLREKSSLAAVLIRGSGTIGILAARLWATTGAVAVLLSNSEAHARWLQDFTRWPPNVHISRCTKLTSTIRNCSDRLEFSAAILCCSREGAPEGLRMLLDVVKDGATIDLMAGFPPDYKEDRLGDVNLDEIRWNNICGNSTSPSTTVVDRLSGKTIYLVGHRGTSGRHILQAIELLSHKVISMADIPHRVLTLEQLPGVMHKMLSPSIRLRTKWVKAIVSFSREYVGESIGDC